MSAFRANAARDRLARWLGAGEAPAGLVLTGPGSVAWVTGGAGPPVDRSADVDLVWAVITPGGAALITTEVEADRIAEEYQPARHGFAELVAVPWYRPEEFVRAAEELAGAPADRLAADGHPAFGRDASADLISLRLALSGPEQDELRTLGGAAAAAVATAMSAKPRPSPRRLPTWKPPCRPTPKPSPSRRRPNPKKGRKAARHPGAAAGGQDSRAAQSHEIPATAHGAPPSVNQP